MLCGMLKGRVVLDVNQFEDSTEVSLPFQLFSTKLGSSTWHRASASYHEILFTISQAAALGEGLSDSDAIQRAFDQLAVRLSSTLHANSNEEGSVVDALWRPGSHTVNLGSSAP